MTDFILGDVYYKRNPARQHQNLDRARNQMKLLESMESQAEQMREVVEVIWRQDEAIQGRV
jgi:inhibitor of KinA sporulation pathway (predicted exonuclease)